MAIRFSEPRPPAPAIMSERQHWYKLRQEDWAQFDGFRKGKLAVEGCSTQLQFYLFQHHGVALPITHPAYLQRQCGAE